MENKDKIALFLIAVILGGGFLIYGVNRFRGIDLGKPPVFDTSVFDLKLAPPTLNVSQPQNTELNAQAIAEIKNKIETLKTDSEKNKIFFSNYFKQATPEETEKFIKSFLEDFPDLQKYPLNTKFVQAPYVAVLDYGNDAETIKPTLEKLAEEFGTVITIK